ncbi:MAG: hypothetical protein AAFX85_18570 [Pseudomonadota bacterium]
MRTIWVSHPACSDHHNAPDNPEIPARTAAIEQRATATGIDARLHRRILAPCATRTTLERAHATSYLDALFDADRNATSGLSGAL